MLCGKREPLPIARHAAAAASCPAAPPAWWQVASPIVRSEVTSTQKLPLPEVQARHRGFPSGRGTAGQACGTPSCAGVLSDVRSPRLFPKLRRLESPGERRRVGTSAGTSGSITGRRESSGKHFRLPTQQRDVRMLLLLEKKPAPHKSNSSFRLP